MDDDDDDDDERRKTNADPTTIHMKALMNRFESSDELLYGDDWILWLLLIDDDDTPSSSQEGMSQYPCCWDRWLINNDMIRRLSFINPNYPWKWLMSFALLLLLKCRYFPNNAVCPIVTNSLHIPLPVLYLPGDRRKKKPCDREAAKNRRCVEQKIQ